MSWSNVLEVTKIYLLDYRCFTNLLSILCTLTFIVSPLLPNPLLLFSRQLGTNLGIIKNTNNVINIPINFSCLQNNGFATFSGLDTQTSAQIPCKFQKFVGWNQIFIAKDWNWFPVEKEQIQDQKSVERSIVF
jgi:hypothetical protein